MSLEENRIFIELELRGPSGRTLRARATIDTGGGGFLVTEKVANELGLARAGEALREGGKELVPIAAPGIVLGGMELSLGHALPMRVTGAAEVMPGSGAQVFLPARVLMQYDVVFDYPARTFSVARPGEGEFRGVRIPSPAHAETGFPRIEAVVDGKPHGFLLDTGASYTMVSQALVEAWSQQHRDWPTLTGAVLEANMLGKKDADLHLLRVPSMEIGGMAVRAVGVVSRPEGVFERWMSENMTAPIVGSIAGNMLRDFCVGIDYAHGATYLEQHAGPHDGDLDSPGLVLAFEDGGELDVAGLARTGSGEIPPAVHPRDRLLAVDGLSVTGATRGKVFDALRGKPGQSRNLRIERDGRTMSLDAPIRHLL